MIPVTTYADAEAAVIDYLTPIAVSADVPIGVRGGGGRFIRVRRIGGVELTPNHDNPTLDVLVWHDTDRSRMALANTLWAALRSANNDPAGDPPHAVLLYGSTVMGPAQMPDPADDTKAMCMFTVAMVIRPF